MFLNPHIPRRFVSTIGAIVLLMALGVQFAAAQATAAIVGNILNHPSFQNPSNIAASPFNANLAAANPLIPTSGVSPNGTMGRITATNSQPRQIQLALKVLF